MSDWVEATPNYKGYVVPTAYCPDCGEQIMVNSSGWACHCSLWSFEKHIEGEKVIKRKRLEETE